MSIENHRSVLTQNSWAERPGLDSQQGRISLFATTQQTDNGPIQRPAQFVPVAPLIEIKLLDRETGHPYLILMCKILGALALLFVYVVMAWHVKGKYHACSWEIRKPNGIYHHMTTQVGCFMSTTEGFMHVIIVFQRLWLGNLSWRKDIVIPIWESGSSAGCQ